MTGQKINACIRCIKIHDLSVPKFILSCHKDKELSTLVSKLADYTIERKEQDTS